ncbi:S-layer homology domain-containing protein [Paenibacillus silvae]|uniref:S-layer homology domain-containing protein n=1 Tax=Paenibacillus silvae TaxID=1325358 RepID=UPI003571426B
MKRNKKRLFAAAMGVVLLSNTFAASNVLAASDETTIPLPSQPAWGYFVDTYKNNTGASMTLDGNPAIGTLSEFLKLWTPGSSWDNGTKLNEQVLNYNIDYVEDRSKTRTAKDEEDAYYTDRRNQTYGAAEGLGALTDVYREKSGTVTSITYIPQEALTTKFTDTNDSNKGGDSNSELGKMVDLVGKVRGDYASTQQAKKFYQYMRPFRWKDQSVIVPTLVAVQSNNPSNDGGFPSGHTNASYLAAIALAYSVPERFQELLTRASEMGDDRIVAGMHSPLDVMGGRVLATAFAASALNDPENQQLKQDAYQQAHDILLKQNGTAEDRFTDYQKNKDEYTQRLTYGFPQINSTIEPAAVPKGAEVLLETRQPYLSSEQRRAVLATTAIASGYPVLDDPEGWGRLNLFAAADGYGAFNHDVKVTMDAAKGGFNAQDVWRNDISGTGKLTKEGSGTLKLRGNNTYSGGTEINGGTLEGDTASALGTGSVTNNSGTVTESVYGKWNIEGNFTQGATGVLELNVATASDVLDVKGAIQAAGELDVNFGNGYVPGAGTFTLVSHDANQRTGQFSSVKVQGLPSKYSTQVVYESNRIALVITDTTNTGTTPTTPGTGGGGSSTAPSTTPSVPSTGTQPLPGTTTPPTTQPTTPPAIGTDSFKSGVVSQESVLKTLNEAIAATKNQQFAVRDITSHWANENINIALKLRVVNGYENGSFKPNAPVTRAEFTAMIARAFGLSENKAANSFKDAGSNWAAGYIGALADKGVIGGYTDGSFKPNATITRAEMIAIIARVLNLNALATDAPTKFSDVKSENWAAGAIELASSAKLVNGLTASEFGPNGKSTRAEAVTIIIRALESDSTIKSLIAGL